jgi:hypothetical protein
MNNILLYIKKRTYLGFVSLFLVIVDLFKNGNTGIQHVVVFVLISIFLILFAAFLDYIFHEIIAVKIVKKLLKNSPLVEFTHYGFSCNENKYLYGMINDFQVFIYPLTNERRNHLLTILIPIENHEKLKINSEFANGFKLIMLQNQHFIELKITNYNLNYKKSELYEFVNSKIEEIKILLFKPIGIDFIP